MLENLGQAVVLVIALVGCGFMVGLGWHAAEKVVFGDEGDGDDAK